MRGLQNASSISAEIDVLLNKLTSKTLALGIEFIKDRFHARELYTGVAPGNTAAKSLYESVGFKETGLVEYNMEEMRLVL